MRNRIVIGLAIFLCSGALAVPTLLWAQNDYGLNKSAEVSGYRTPGGPEPASLYQIIGQAISAGLSLIAIAFFGFMLYSGLRWMTARGNDELAERAKNNIETTIIGLVIILLSYALVRFVLMRF